MFLFPLRCQFIWLSLWFCSLKSVRCASGLLLLWVLQCRLKPTRTMLEVRRLDSWTTGKTWDQTLNTDCPQDTPVFCWKKHILDPKFCWTQRRTVNILIWMGHPWATGWRWQGWPCGLLREADKLPNGYRGDTAEGLMDPLAKATCHISIRSVLVFFGVSCRPKVYESLLEDSFQISLQRSLFWYEANRKSMRTTVV